MKIDRMECFCGTSQADTTELINNNSVGIKTTLSTLATHQTYKFVIELATVGINQFLWGGEGVWGEK